MFKGRHEYRWEKQNLDLGNDNDWSFETVSIFKGNEQGVISAQLASLLLPLRA